MFESLSDRLSGVFRSFSGRGQLTEENIQAGLREVRLALLEADVNFKVVKDFVENVRQKCLGQELIKGVSPAQQVVKIVHEELVGLLGGETAGLNLQGQEPAVIMLVGLQGSGKTTAAAKLAMAYAFDALNLYKLYLVVDNENVRAIHVYSKLGFQAEGVLIHEFFANGAYHDATRMCIFQHEYRSLYGSDSGPAAALPGDGPDPVR